MNPKIRNIIIFAGIFALLVAGYVLFFGKPSAEVPALMTTSGTAGSSTANTVAGGEVGREFLATLLSLRTIKLDTTIFSSPAFLSLRDFELTLIQEANPGRTNPFSPLGVEPAAGATVTPSVSAPTPAPTPTPVTSPTPTTGQ